MPQLRDLSARLSLALYRRWNGPTMDRGKIADVLVVNGDRLQDLHALTNVRLVVRNGTIIRDEGN